MNEELFKQVRAAIDTIAYSLKQLDEIAAKGNAALNEIESALTAKQQELEEAKQVAIDNLDWFNSLVMDLAAILGAKTSTPVSELLAQVRTIQAKQSELDAALERVGELERVALSLLEAIRKDYTKFNTYPAKRFEGRAQELWKLIQKADSALAKKGATDEQV